MAFPRKYLHEGEEIVLDRKPHAWFLVKSGSVLVLVAVLWAVVAILSLVDGTVGRVVHGAFAVVFLITLLWFALRWLRWQTTNFVVTTDRLVYRAGIIAKSGREIPLERINDIQYSQGIFERLIHSGDLLIESGGENGQQRFTDVSGPYQLQNEIYRQMERTSARDMDRMAGRRALSVPEQIEKLDELRSKGVLSQAEFDAKKAQLLDRL